MTSSLTLVLAAAALLPTAAAAATYSATPLVAVAEKRILDRDINWACGPSACKGATEYGRPLTLCQGLVRQAGRVERFLVDGRALATDELDKCNSVARAPSSLIARN